MFRAGAPARTGSGIVIFEPVAHTAWHTHPRGPILIVTSGGGLVQQWRGRPQQIFPGNIVWIPLSVKHWHGALPTTWMTHIAISEALEGKSVDWLEQVSSEQHLSSRMHGSNP
jgi:4-carboxymuconolactone decarboxylase